ncbi:MAG: hypothetical protein HC806_00420 [Anaerolineae bacterium]|nr:hypothetical protein [Anaerolineae bacterium]
MNHGPNRAVNIILSDFMPKGVFINSVISSLANCSTIPLPVNHVTCDIPWLNPGEVETVQIVVTALQPGQITNFAFSTNHGKDFNPANNSTSKTVQILPFGFTAPILQKVTPK